MPVSLRFLELGLPPSVPGPWVYLGTRTSMLLAASKALSSGRLSTGRRMEQKALEIRSEFVRWIGELASNQTSLEDFWSYSFTCRSPETSELFELLVRALVARDLAREHADLSIFVDDPFLFQTLEMFASKIEGHAEAEKAARKSLARARLRRPIARFVFLVRGFTRILLAKFLFRKPRNDSAVWAVGYAFEGALSKRPYVDPFFGTLPEIVGRLSRKFQFLFPLHTPSSAFSSISKIESATVLAAWAGFSDLFRAAFGPDPANFDAARTFSGCDVGPLIERELCFERASNRLPLNRWQFGTWRKFAASESGSVVSIFENHPWEKALSSAVAATSRLVSVGYQHSVMGRTLMNYIPAGDAERKFHPAVIVSNCDENVERLKDYGWPAAMCFNGGALRYVGGLSKIGESRIERAERVVYVVFPGVRTLAENFAAALQVATRELRETKLLLKFHPSVVLEPEKYAGIRGGEVTTRSLVAVEEKIDAVLYVSSTLGLESALMGIPAIRYVPEGQLSLDPAPSGLLDKMPTCDWESLPTILAAMTKRTAQERLADGAERYLFGPIDESVWARVLQGK